MTFAITDLRARTIWNLYRIKERIQLDPDYQRSSEIWTLEKRQLLIDTILNGFDIPKLYLHKFSHPIIHHNKRYEYAIVDGKQRLESMWDFIDGVFALADDFEFFGKAAVKAGGMKYAELGQGYPDLKSHFDGFLLDVVLIETDDVEMIEEMFSRLNEAVPLTAPEKRNALAGPVPPAIRKLAKEPFFGKSLPFPNKRYRHFDLSVKFLLAERDGKVVDTKKVYLDEFVRSYSEQPKNKSLPFVKPARRTVSVMNAVFANKDLLLRQVGMVSVYYHLFRIAIRDGWEKEITRQRINEFEKLRQENRKAAEVNLAKADYELIEFDRYNQSPNDAYAIRFRLEILLRRTFKKTIPIAKL